MAQNNKTTRFTSKEKNALKTGQEITDGDIIWRKLSDGTGVWRYDFTRGGQRFKGTLGREKDGVTLSQARTELQRIRAQATLQAPVRRNSSSNAVPIADQQPFEEAAQSFLRWSEAHHSDYSHNKSRMEQHVLPRFSGKVLGEITSRDVEDFRVDLLHAGLARSTIQRIVSVLSNVYEYARQRDPNLRNPTRGLRKLRAEPTDIQVFDEAELEKLLDPKNNPSIRERAMVGLAAFGGLRASEVLGLQWEHVDLEKGQIQIRQTVLDGEVRPTTKSGKTRSVPISKSLEPLLMELHGAAGASQWLFPGRTPDKPMHQVQHVFHRMKERARLSDAPSFHALRHTFATRALEHQVTVHVLKEWLGHSSIQMTEQYVHFTGKHSDQMAALLP
ncbi:site-specific integrase [Arhodomonas aquaeolei]|uniref:site-specific integrase n=1 Tax=Arhodomonas aquaeolei TaxID=2369 RepID=UPI002166F8DB|nr:site-specific integrase [Arhodomonas aquaeolei]MCS4504306.1 site-specific integrase [Arhodomonas aquaeolei]